MSSRRRVVERERATATNHSRPFRLLRQTVRDVFHRVTAPQPIVRLETLRILIPLAILGFMSSRLVHADEWVGDGGFQLPDLLGSDLRQTAYLPPLPGWTAWALACLMSVSGLFTAVGFLTRYAAGVFTFTLVWTTLADPIGAYTVSRLGTVLALALWLAPCGTRHGLDSWIRRKRSADSGIAPTSASGLTVHFFQLTLVVVYASSGICKARNDWLTEPYLLWTLIHDSYQTAFSHFIANRLPLRAWTVLQAVTLIFESLAPLWFALQWTRPLALACGVGMHAMIGLMFGPVIWFSLLMTSLLVACFAPVKWLEKTVGRLP